MLEWHDARHDAIKPSFSPGIVRGSNPIVMLDATRQGNERADAGHSDHGRGLNEREAWLALRRHPIASRWEIRAQDKFALKAARLETVMCLGDLIEGDPLGDARPDGAGCQQAEEPL